MYTLYSVIMLIEIGLHLADNSQKSDCNS